MTKFKLPKILGVLCFLLVFKSLNAQNINPYCATDQIHQKALSEDERYRLQFDKTQAYFRNLNISNYKTVATGSGDEYHVPVVVHVLHTGGAIGSNYNPNDAAILSFINHINEGFSNTNDITTIAGTYNSVNIPIRFYLAQRDELNACSATTGINRLNQSSNATYVANGVGTPGISDAALKSIIHWNDLDYYNIYIVNKIDGVDGYCAPCTFTAGYAFFPLLGGNKVDGMVVLAQQVSQSTEVFIHELGHAFNLIHPFEGGNASTCPSNTSCTTNNDEICDTDPVRLDFTCNPSGTNPCTSINWSSSTIQYNYMNYFGCADRFTAGQSTRINNTINLIRAGYKNSAGIDPPPSQLPPLITAPTYTAANLGNTFDMGPTYVGFNSIDYYSGGYTYEGFGSKYYLDHTCNQSTTLMQGNSYPLSIKTELNPQKVKVYIDYNHDGTFGTTAPELVYAHVGTLMNETHLGNITIPSSGVVLGVPLRMRVIADFSSNITPTMQILYGQAEDYTVNIQSLALPVIWKNFSASLVENNHVDLRWSTEMEFNNDYFEIERGKDGISYFPIAKSPGNKEKYTPSFYSFIDKNATSGDNYYRIKQIDIDKKVNYSSVNIVNISQPHITISVYPNPVSDIINIDLKCQDQDVYALMLTDLNGQIIYREQGLSNQELLHKKINTQNLQTGLYILNVRTEYETKNFKIIKSH